MATIVRFIEMDGKSKREFKLDFNLEKDKDGKINGFTVRAQPQGEAEWFCTTFPRAMATKEASIAINLRKKVIVLRNKKCPFQPAEVSFGVDKEEFKELVAFHRKGQFTIKDLRPEIVGFSVTHV